jgi:hypothetical protein
MWRWNAVILNNLVRRLAVGVARPHHRATPALSTSKRTRRHSSPAQADEGFSMRSRDSRTSASMSLDQQSRAVTAADGLNLCWLEGGFV